MTADPLDPWYDAGLIERGVEYADGRLDVIRAIADDGRTPDEFAGVEPEELMRAVNTRTYRPGPFSTLDEARKRSALAPEVFDRLARAVGHSEGALLTDADVAAMETFVVAIDVFTTDELLHFVRVASSSVARIADAAAGLYRSDVMGTEGLAETSALETYRQNVEAAGLVQLLGPILDTFLTQQLELAARRGDEGRQSLAPTVDASTLRVAIGFVDIVGYTSMAGELGSTELGHFIKTFEERAYDIVTAHQGRVVKLIGDEVMFVANDAGDACTIATDLIRAFSDSDATPRGGVAWGDVISQGGDYYGRIVNLAARIANLAVPAEVLVDADTAAEVGLDRFDPAGRRQLKGFPEPVPLMSVRLD